MLRVIGTIITSDMSLCFVLWNEKTGATDIIEHSALLARLHAGDKLRNAALTEKGFRVLDCAANKLPQFNENGTLLTSPVQCWVVARTEDTYYVLSCSNFIVGTMTEQELCAFMRHNPDSVRNAYLKDTTVVIKDTSCVPMIHKKKKYKYEVWQEAPVGHKFAAFLAKAQVSAGGAITIVTGLSRIQYLVAQNFIDIPADLTEKTILVFRQADFNEITGIDPKETVKLTCRADLLSWCERHKIMPSEFNQPVILKPADSKATEALFFKCFSFNQPVEIPDGVTSCQTMFGQCYLLNSQVTLSPSIADCSTMFAQCYHFNQRVILPKALKTAESMFTCCYVFNQPFKIPDNTVNIDSMLMNATSFNQPFWMPDAIETCEEALKGCTSFDNLIRLAPNVESARGVFALCESLNQPVDIPDTATDLSMLFFGCTKFNKSVSIPPRATDCSQMFMNCTSFNQSVDLPDGIKDCSCMFMNSGYNHKLVIPNSVTDCTGMLWDCKEFMQEVVFKGRNHNMKGFEKITNNHDIFISVQ